MDEQVKKILDEYEKRIFKLETFLPKETSKKPLESKTSLSDHIITLRDSGFFSEPKIAEEVHQELQENYHCEVNRVSMALLRLSNKKELRKASKVINDKKYKAYVC